MAGEKFGHWPKAMIALHAPLMGVLSFMPLSTVNYVKENSQTCN